MADAPDGGPETVSTGRGTTGRGTTGRGTTGAVTAGRGTTETLLAFLTTSCAECQPFWEMLAGAATRDDLGAHVAVVTPSRSMEDERLARRLVPDGIHLHMGSETWFEYGIGRAASFALVRSPSDGPPPWVEVGEILGAANVEAPEELIRLLKSWRAAAAV
jgi:hypothetical protein